MRARLIPIAAAAVVLGTLAAAPPAQAGHLDWSFGVGFHVGGLHFRVGFAPYGHAGYPGPFFFTTSRLHYPGYGCHGACFRRGPAFYHHASCPLVGLHFGRVGYRPGYFIDHYAPHRFYGRGYAPYRNRAYGHYYRDGYRDRFRSPGSRHYRGDRHYRGRRDPGYRGERRYRPDRGRRPDYDHDSDSDSDRGRSFRGDRGRRGRDGDRERARPRRGARHTRPPR